MKRVLAFIIILATGAAAGAAGYAWWLGKQASEQPNVIELYGNVDIRDAQLAFNGQEHIAEVLVEEGDEVNQGDLLATLETDRIEAQLVQARAQRAAQEALVRRLKDGTRKQEIEQARAEVEAAQARAGNAQRTVQRLGETAESGASSEQNLDDAEARLKAEQAGLRVRQEALDLALEGPRKEDIEQAEAQLDALEAEIEQLTIHLCDSELIAPSPGVIQSRLREPGEWASPAAPVFTLALQDPKWVRAYLPEPDLGRVKPGMEATVHTDSFPNTSFSGWVGFISPRAEFTPKAVQTTDLRTKLVYELRVYVRDPENQLRLGQPVTVRLDTSPEPPTEAAARSEASPPASGSAPEE